MTQLLHSMDHCHIAVAAFQAWGHCKPQCILVARIARARPVVVTFLIPGIYYDRAVEELSRCFDDTETDVQARVRLFPLKGNEQNMLDTDAMNASFVVAYQALLEERPLTCYKTSREFASAPKPHAIILDFFAIDMFRSIKQQSQNSIKIYCWIVFAAVVTDLFFGPSSANKGRNIDALVEEEAKRTGRPALDIAHDLMLPVKGDIVRLPGVTAMYDYEHIAQTLMVDNSLAAFLHMGGAEIINKSDGALIGSPDCFEPPEAISVLRRWFSESGGRELYLVGPMLSTLGRPQTSDLLPKEKAEFPEFDAFMNRIMKSHGSKSMIYMAFGSVFWSVKPETIWTFLDVLVERDIPFIFSHASPFAQVPDHVKAKIESWGLGMLTSWCPQPFILSHPVTGWFVTHCGINSLMESIDCGVPMICWPFQSDQPLNTVLLTENHGVAYELFETRNGVSGLKPMLRKGKAAEGTDEALRREANCILDQAFGEDGKKKRANVEKLRESMRAALAEGGSSQAALDNFLYTL